MQFSRPTLLIVAAALTLSAAACSPTTSATESTPDPHALSQAAFPVTLEVPGVEQPLEIAEEPSRIAALSPDAAIALHELGLTDRIVAIPRGATSEALNPYAADMAEVPNVVAAENAPEPEQVLSWSPDLIVVTSRHTGEQDAAETLGATGVPVLTLTNGWSSPDAVVENLALIGAATGTSERAAQLGDEITSGLAQVGASAEEAVKSERRSGSQEAPTVAILSNQAQVPFINAGSSLVSELVSIGGGRNAADQIGVTQTMPIQPEQLVAANPDFIMLVDVTGKGDASFDAVLANPAVAALPAVQEGRVRTFLGREMYGLAGTEVVTASEQVFKWLHPGAAQ